MPAPAPAEPLSQRLRAAIERGVDSSFRRMFAEADTAIMPPPMAQPAAPQLDPQAEQILHQHDERPDVAIGIRQKLLEVGMPGDAQIAWLIAYYTAKEYQQAHPDVEKDFPVTTAWRAVIKDQQGWRPAVRTAAVLLEPIVTQQDENLWSVAYPGGNGEVAKKDFDSKEAAESFAKEGWKSYSEREPSGPPADKLSTELSPFEADPEAKERGRPKDIEDPESQPGQSLIRDANDVLRVINRVREIGLKENASEKELAAARAMTKSLSRSGVRLTDDDWKKIREAGFEALNKTPQELMEAGKAAAASDSVVDKLNRAIILQRFISIMENPKVPAEIRDAASESYADLMYETGGGQKTVERVLGDPRRRAIARRGIQTWARESVKQLAGELRHASSLGDETTAQTIRNMLTGFVQRWESTTPGGQAFVDATVNDIIKTAQEVTDMPRTAKVEFDARLAKWTVLHANLLKPLSFKSREEAESVAKAIDGDGPSVVKDGDAFKVSSPDWTAPVAARTAAEAQEIVEKKLVDLGAKPEEAKTEAEALVQASLKKTAEDEAVGGVGVIELTPKAITNIQELAEEIKVPEAKLRELIQQLNSETKTEASKEGNKPMGTDGQAVSAATKQKHQQGEVGGFANTDVSAGNGKHPVVPGLVSTEGPAIQTIEPGKPGAAAAKFDGTTKKDPNESKVNSQHGLTREQQGLLTAAATFDAQAELTIRAARISADVEKLTATPEGMAVLEKAIELAKAPEAVAPAAK